MTTAVYFLEIDGLLKIGFSADLRVRQITLGGKYRGAMFGGREIERTLHEELAAFRVTGEKFHRDPILLATVDRLIAERGVAGDACLSLTDPAFDPAATVERRELEIAARIADVVKAEVDRLAKTTAVTKAQAKEILAAKAGVPSSFVWDCLYRPPAVVSAAIVEAISANFGKRSDCLSFLASDEMEEVS